MRFNPRKYPLFHEPSGIYYRRDVDGTYFVHTSEIFWAAANKFLAVNEEEFCQRTAKHKYSCSAVEETIWELIGPYSSSMELEIKRMINAAGVDTDSLNLFGDHAGIPKDKEHIQQERYMLLMFQYQCELTDGCELAIKQLSPSDSIPSI